MWSPSTGPGLAPLGGRLAASHYRLSFLQCPPADGPAPALGRRSKGEWPYSYPRDAVFFSLFLFLGFRITSHSFPAGPAVAPRGVWSPRPSLPGSRGRLSVWKRATCPARGAWRGSGTSQS